ncbi:MAG: TonB-dependent receptor [Bacteroidaceae bacterium]|nr:TonB-dependent receptor [Bacteroidaceae bacterium]
MEKKLLLAAFLSLPAAIGFAQNNATKEAEKDMKQDNAAFTFTEQQLGEDDDMTQNVIMVNSNSNLYTSNVGYLWSPVRFKFRAYDSKYSETYMNGVQVNNLENGQFNFSTVGGMNDATRNQDAAAPFESNAFCMAGIGGSSNYDFRASNFAVGQKVTLSAVNRNYSARAMYSYGSGLNEKGWAFFGTIGYRWADMNTAAVKGTFYNSISGFLAVEKRFDDRHSLNLAVWGNHAERAQQGASTDEAYWLANDRQYNPYWGYQNGEKRASRIVNNFEPSALLTWDYQINDRMKLTTSAFIKYALYSATRLNYNGQNPAPDYWKNFPSYNYDVWGATDGNKSQDDYLAWAESRDYWMASERNRQINFDKLYYTNQQVSTTGRDAIYWIEAKHNNHLATNLGSTFDWSINKSIKLQAGIQLASNKGMHYTTMHDMLGGQYFHNVNTYAKGSYASTASELQYDLNNPNGEVKEGDKMRYDYDIITQNAKLWTALVFDKGITHSFAAAKIGGQQMWRDGHMLNGFYDPAKGWDKNASYGKSKTARFLDGGVKAGSTLNLGGGSAVTMGIGAEARAPHAKVAFVSPEMNNNFVSNLKNEKILSAELGYALNTKWMRMNLTGYLTHTYDGTEWENFYFDDGNSFAYVSLTDVKKIYYGAELGLKFKVTSNLDVNVIGTLAEAEYADNTNISYMLSTKGTVLTDVCHNKGMRESGTPLAAASVGLSYSINRWYIDLNGNYYDRIYLSDSPSMRFGRSLAAAGLIENDGSFIIPDQAKGKGGFMLDFSIGHQFRIAHRPLSVNLMITNLLNNRNICTGGYEQSRSDYSINSTTGTTNQRTYSFSNNPKKFYAQGINGMLNINYRF